MVEDEGANPLDDHHQGSAPANQENAPRKRKESKHSEVDRNKGIASIPPEPAYLPVSVYPVRR
jgi:hypothetical protein